MAFLGGIARIWTINRILEVGLMDNMRVLVRIEERGNAKRCDDVKQHFITETEIPKMSSAKAFDAARICINKRRKAISL